jgi:hypothetical protein
MSSSWFLVSDAFGTRRWKNKIKIWMSGKFAFAVAAGHLAVPWIARYISWAHSSIPAEACNPSSPLAASVVAQVKSSFSDSQIPSPLLPQTVSLPTALALRAIIKARQALMTAVLISTREIIVLGLMMPPFGCPREIGPSLAKPRWPRQGFPSLHAPAGDASPMHVSVFRLLQLYSIYNPGEMDAETRPS